MSDMTPPEGYDEFLGSIKEQIQAAQLRAALSLSRELAGLYWNIGQEILQRQARHGWGAKVVARLAADLKASFPGIEGFSLRNLNYMRAFAEAYPDSEIAQQLLRNSPIPWGHHVRILDKVKDAEQPYQDAALMRRVSGALTALRSLRAVRVSLCPTRQTG